MGFLERSAGIPRVLHGCALQMEPFARALLSLSVYITKRVCELNVGWNESFKGLGSRDFSKKTSNWSKDIEEIHPDLRYKFHWYSPHGACSQAVGRPCSNSVLYAQRTWFRRDRVNVMLTGTFCSFNTCSKVFKPFWFSLILILKIM